MGTYVVGDIHGCLEAWLKLKDMIESYDKQARFILIGDIVDRGPKVMKMLDWAMKNITPDGKYQMILGNHEDMKITWAKQYEQFKGADFSKTQHYQEFKSDGYDFQDWLTMYDVTDDYVLKIIDFFKSLPLYIELDIETFGRIQHYIICHASIPDVILDENGRIIEEKIKTVDFRQYGYESAKDCILWDRNYWGNSWEAPTIVVHGHTPTVDRDLVVRWADPGRIDFRNKDINLDCGACYKMSTSNLAAICLETLEEFYYKDIEDNCYTAGSRSQSYKKDMLHLLKTGENKYETMLNNK